MQTDKTSLRQCADLFKPEPSHDWKREAWRSRFEKIAIRNLLEPITPKMRKDDILERVGGVKEILEG